MYFTFKRFVLLAGKRGRAWTKIVDSTPQRVDLLLAVRECALPQKFVAMELCVTKSVVSRMVDGLEGLGLVKRVIPLCDRRVRLVTITAKGIDVLEKMHDNYLADPPYGNVQLFAEGSLLYEWEPVLKKHRVRTKLLSTDDQRELLQRMQPAVWRSVYYGDPRWDNANTPHRVGLIEQHFA